MSFLYKPRKKNGDIINFPQVFEKVLIGNGCWLTEGDPKDKWFKFKNILYNIYGWIVYVNLSFIIFCEMAYFLVNIKDVRKAVESFCPSMIGFFIVVRTLHFRLVTEDLKRLLKSFAEKIWIDGDKYPRIVKRCHRIMRPVFVYFVLMFNVLILYSIIPIFVFFTTNQSLESKDKRMPYSMIFPYDAQTGYIYFVTYIAAILAGYVVISHFYALDALLLMFVSYLSGQFEILHGEIVRLIPECHAEWLKRYGVEIGVSIGGNNDVGYDAQPDARMLKLLQDMYTKRLHELSARHNDLISFSVRLNESISFPLLVNVVNSTFLICFCGFQFLLSTNTAFYLYLCNWEGGQLSKDSPLLLKPEDMDAASLSAKLPLWKHIKYYPAGKDFCNKLRFMIMRSQRPVQMDAMKFTILSLESFSKILSSSMSYFALLKTFLDKQK
ncbi:putative odorant receptor 13a [Lucilia cuprina]|uniref:Odorant receptor n=1 Tax=Lucilia cuprina TaxID=7375 RepID=A0A0L0CQI8_LUCCU|nr:putative odorant receptor 13a [Lucilia cuprina]